MATAFPDDVTLNIPWFFFSLRYTACGGCGIATPTVIDSRVESASNEPPKTFREKSHNSTVHFGTKFTTLFINDLSGMVKEYRIVHLNAIGQMMA